MTTQAELENDMLLASRDYLFGRLKYDDYQFVLRGIRRDAEAIGMSVTNELLEDVSRAEYATLVPLALTSGSVPPSAAPLAPRPWYTKSGWRLVILLYLIWGILLWV